MILSQISRRFALRIEPVGLLDLREDQELFDDFLGSRGSDLFAKSHPNLAHLSETDIEILDQTILQYGHLTAKQLRDLSHRERAWKDAAV